MLNNLKFGRLTSRNIYSNIDSVWLVLMEDNSGNYQIFGMLPSSGGIGLAQNTEEVARIFGDVDE